MLLLLTKFDLNLTLECFGSNPQLTQIIRKQFCYFIIELNSSSIAVQLDFSLLIKLLCDFNSMEFSVCGELLAKRKLSVDNFL
jgi:hypothetical protein